MRNRSVRRQHNSPWPGRAGATGTGARAAARREHPGGARRRVLGAGDLPVGRAGHRRAAGYPGAHFSRTFFFPDIEAQYHNWVYVSATDLLGVYAYNHQGTKLGAAIEWDFTERLARDSPSFARLGDAPTTPRLKLFAQTRIAMFSGGVNVAADVGGHDEGTLAQAHVHPLSSVLLGTITAAGGGTMRGVLLAYVPAILRVHVYATAALFGAVALVVCRPRSRADARGRNRRAGLLRAAHDPSGGTGSRPVRSQWLAAAPPLPR